MQETPFARTRLLLGDAALEKLANARVAVFGLGGVGSFAAEALVRAGVGSLLFVDNDTVSLSNLNRQLLATHHTVGQMKTRLMRERAAAINPEAAVETAECFVLPDNLAGVLTGRFDYILDAIDTVSAKIALVLEAGRRGIPLISVMGTGNKLDPGRLTVADLYQTSVCPLCRVMRRELRERGVDALRVVYSQEPPLTPREYLAPPEGSSRRQIPGSVSFVPPAAGMLAAGEVVRHLAGVPAGDGKRARERA